MVEVQSGSRRFLVKLSSETANSLAAQSLTIVGAEVTLQPLFATPKAGAGQGIAAAADKWFITKVKDEPKALAQWSGLSDWDVAHRLARETNALVVEPDILQKDYWPEPQDRGLGAGGADRCDPGGPQASAPPPPHFGWHLDIEFGQLGKAREGIGSTPAPVTIAHLDTGYDPHHAARPKNIDVARQRNFYDEDRPNDATDPIDPQSLLHTLGHGTGTIGILAGRAPASALPPEAMAIGPIGGAPDATIVPVRIANFVAHIRTSTIAQGLDYARQIGADVVSMSMGGWPSQAWADAVNDAYEAGVVLVCAAGNHYNGLPMRQIVWPARFQRVVAACGIMSNGKPYADLGLGEMEGCYGPPSKMGTAVAAYTPNIPWPILGCQNVIARHGTGTSSATPQVAAAAALWLQKHKPALDSAGIRGWMRVEMVRRALFDTAADGGTAAQPHPWFGRGVVKADTMLASEPVPARELVQTPRDRAWFPFADLLFGRALAPDPAFAGLALEATQIAARSARVTAEFPDLQAADPATAQRIAQILLEYEVLSGSLRSYLEAAVGTRPRNQIPGAGLKPPAPTALGRSLPEPPDVAVVAASTVQPPPKARRLRIYATDPLAANRLDSLEVSEATVEVPWEPASGNIEPGPVGEYVAVIDVDPASGLAYRPVDLDDRYVVADGGLAPSVADPQFHQQMVYAVAMRTINRFELALGRVALWAPKPRYWEDGKRSAGPVSQGAGPVAAWFERGFVRRLRIYPHALRQANAYYSPAKLALLFGYFPESRKIGNRIEPGETIFTCLSQDIIAHETTHALLDGIHRRYQEATNLDVLAFHEAFADIVALFQRFSLTELLRHEIQASRGDLSRSSLGQLARQFGEGLGRAAALRDALGSDPAVTNYDTETEPHQRGAVLVAAVFDAYIRIVRNRTADLLRLAGIGDRGARRELHPDLVERLAGEATKAAGHVLDICIRALDYCPPVDLCFSDYLRALITADSDLLPDDTYGYRVAFMESFRARRIYPIGIRSVSTETLRWGRPADQPTGLVEGLKTLPLVWSRKIDRLEAYSTANQAGKLLHDWLEANLSDTAAAYLKLDRSAGPDGVRMPFEVHSVRPARRISFDGHVQRDIIAVITQKRIVKLDPQGPDTAENQLVFRSGVTLVMSADAERDPIRYAVWKSPWSEERLKAAREFMTGRALSDGMQLYFGGDGAEEAAEPFALLHWGH
jgi:hypothetical protein